MRTVAPQPTPLPSAFGCHLPLKGKAFCGCVLQWLSLASDLPREVAKPQVLTEGEKRILVFTCMSLPQSRYRSTAPSSEGAKNGSYSNHSVGRKEWFLLNLRENGQEWFWLNFYPRKPGKDSFVFLLFVLPYNLYIRILP